MEIEITGPRILVRAYSLPEAIGSIVVPDYYREGWDGKLYELEQASQAFKAKLTACATLDSKQIIALRTRYDEPLELEPDDIISCKGQFRGIYAGPEIERAKGYACWFLNATEHVGSNNQEQPTIEWVWPAKTWRQTATHAVDGQSNAVHEY